MKGQQAFVATTHAPCPATGKQQANDRPAIHILAISVALSHFEPGGVFTSVSKQPL